MKNKNILKKELFKLLCILCTSTALIYSCKKGANVDSSHKEDNLVEIAKKLYTQKTDSPKIDVDWEDYKTIGDSIIIVKTETRGITSINQKNGTSTISGLVFKMKNKKVVNLKLLEFYGNKPSIQSKGLEILSIFDRMNSGIALDGAFLQYSPRNYRFIGSYAVKNGAVDKNRQVLLKKSPTKATQAAAGVCDPVYLIVFERSTGRVISQTYLYDSCGEEEDIEENITHYTEEGSECAQVDISQVITYEEAGETNGIEIGNEIADTRVVTYEWVVIRNRFGFWDYISTEKGTHKKVGSEWRWDNIEHLKAGINGQTPFTEITISEFNFIPTIGKYYAGGTAHFNYKAKLLCDIKFNPIPGINKVMKVNSPLWHVDETY